MLLSLPAAVRIPLPPAVRLLCLCLCLVVDCVDWNRERYIYYALLSFRELCKSLYLMCINCFVAGIIYTDSLFDMRAFSISDKEACSPSNSMRYNVIGFNAAVMLRSSISARKSIFN